MLRSKKVTESLALMLVVIFTLPTKATADITCNGRFVNPITDICWSCILPISIGNIVNIGSGSAPKKRDTRNPSSPLCLCTKAGVPVPGITIGF